MRNWIRKLFFKLNKLVGIGDGPCLCPYCDYDLVDEEFTPHGDSVFNFEVVCPICNKSSVWDFEDFASPYTVVEDMNDKLPPYNPSLPANVPIGCVSDGYHTFDELYEHRHLLFCLATKNPGLKSWRAKFHDDGSHYSGYFIAGIHLPSGDITYHLPYKYWGLLNHAETYEKAPTWDGHTSSDVVDRLRVFLQS